MGALSRAMRGVREHAWLSFVSTSVIAASLMLVGGFALGILNLRTVVSSWESDAHISAYLRADTSSGTVDGLRNAIAQRSEVAEVTFVSEDDARAWVAKEMPDLAPSMADFQRGTLPASFEIRVKPEYATPEKLDAFVEDLRGMGPWTEVDYGEEWVARFANFVDTATMLGAGLGALVATACVLLVANTVNLVVYARRDELEIMRLVGATDGYILGPFLVEGALQGLLAGGVAVSALRLLHVVLSERLASVVTATTGGNVLMFLPMTWLLALVGSGLLLGAVASWLSVRRFLGKLP